MPGDPILGLITVIAWQLLSTTPMGQESDHETEGILCLISLMLQVVIDRNVDREGSLWLPAGYGGGLTGGDEWEEDLFTGL
jgi:hypothetical protein